MRSTTLSAVALAAVVFTLSACTATGDSSDPAATADVATAEANIAPFLDTPSEFPVTEPLIARPTGKKIAVLDCGSPICGLFADLASAPAEILGMSVTRIEAGTTADGVNTAFDTVLQGGFDGVFVPAIAPSLWERPLAELNAAGIPVVTSGVVGLPEGAVGAAGASEISSESSGRLLADWSVVQDAEKTNVVFYTTPELSFSAVINQGFLDEMKAICAGCTVRTVEIPVAQFGSGAPQIVVDDLLAHPDTTTAVFAVGEQAIGLAPALKTADISIKTILNSPDPSILAGVQDGTFTAGLGVDLAVLTWVSIDSLARLVTGQEADPGARNDLLVRQFLTAENLAGLDVSQGWTGYPDFADRFMALWADAK